VQIRIEKGLPMVSRRQFLWRSATAAAAAMAFSRSAPLLFADPLGWPIGFQAYDVRFLLMTDWDKGWDEIKAIGFRAVDLVSFKGYGYEKSPLADMPAKQIRDKFDSIGMQCDNCQFYFSELHDQFDTKMEFAHTMRLKYVICAPSPDHAKTADDWKWQADKLNLLGEKIEKAGFHLGYHNHEIEFLEVDGQVPYDILMKQTDPHLVKFQIDVGNLTFGGGDAIAYLKRYKDRYFSMHAKDYLPGKSSVPVGKGKLNWPEIFEVVKTTKIESYFAEVAAYAIGSLHGMPMTAWPTDSVDQLRESYLYLHNLKVK
jgi:sugar phosphate isomerase/epimerase